MTKKPQRQRPQPEPETPQEDDPIIDGPCLESPKQTSLLSEFEEREALIGIAEFLFRNQVADA